MRQPRPRFCEYSRWLIAALLTLGLTTACEPKRPTAAATSLPRDVAYIGSAACAECHAAQSEAWRTSQHARAQQAATPETVLGRFDGRRLRFGDSSTTYFKAADGNPRLRSEDAQGKPIELPVSDVIGLAPLQQYLVTLPDGRKQSLGVAWDARPAAAGGQRWFHVFPEQGTRPGSPLHWSGIDQTWNYQCADCHATNLRKGYDAKTQRYTTTWSELGAGCEACHGPGAAHLAWARQPDPSTPNKGLTAALDERRDALWTPVAQGTAQRSRPRETEREIEVCARCHARRGQLSDAARAGDPLLDHFRPALIEPGLYYADGQQRDEVYTWGSFLQSRMHAAGVTCADCHEPHSGRLRAEGNAVCAQCHDPARFDRSEHHRHAPGTPGAACVACHAPTTIYMGVDPRHDHSFRIPRPEIAARAGAPDACTGCHRDKSTSWAAAKISTWFPQPKSNFQSFGEIFIELEHDAPAVLAKLSALFADPTQPAIARASALELAARHLPAADEPTRLRLLNGAYEAITDASGLVRAAATRLLASAPPATQAYHLTPRLSDPLRLVRIEAARVLAGPGERALTAADQPTFATALAELVAAESFNADRPEALANLAQLYERRGDAKAAESALEQALALDRRFAPAWVALAQLRETLGDREGGLALFAEGARSVPESAELAHAEGLALHRAGRRDAALTALAKAHRLAPGNSRIHFVYAIALRDAGRTSAAREALRALLHAAPKHRDARRALAELDA